MPDHDKTIYCQGKHRKRHPASNVAAESAPHPRHAVKVCANDSNNSQQHDALAKIGNTLFCSRRGYETFNQQPFPGSWRSVGHARALLFVKVAPVLKSHCSNLIFGTVNTLAFWTPTSGPPQLRWKLAAQTKPNGDPIASCQELRVSLARFHTAKNGIATRYHFSLWPEPLRQIHTLECGNPVFGVAIWRLERPQLLQKFTRNNESTKGRKDDTNIHVLNIPPAMSPMLCCESLRQQHPNNSKQNGALAKMGCRYDWCCHCINTVNLQNALVFPAW